MIKSHLLQLIQSERALLEATLAQVRKDRMDEPGVCGAWSVKDVLAHIVAWEELMVRCLREIQDRTVPGLVPYGIPDDALDELNGQIHEENRGKPLDQVLQEFERSYGQSVRAVEAMPEEELLAVGKMEELGNEPLWHMVAANTCWHYRDHRASLEAWQEGLRGDEAPYSSRAKKIASEIDAQIRALPVQNTPSVRAIRRQYSRKLRQAKPEFVLEVARELLGTYGYRGVSYELIRHHQAAFQSVGEAELKGLGQGINSWWSVDSFARTLAGPAWLKGQVSDELIHRWAHSPDLWWRRAALVSTVALNVRSHGGHGDVSRTLEVCRLLVHDHEDMVVKAMSWALRELVVHDPDAVREFLKEHEDVLAARVKREVRNKLTTGLKKPTTL